MSRIIKEREVRYREIVEIAKTLFEKNGYENTSVESIIKTANIAKGTFYYYFSSKKDILSAVVNGISEEMFDFIQKITNSPDISTIDKLNQIFVSSDKQLIANSKIMKTIHHIENRELQEQLNVQYIEKIVPLITEVFVQGYQEGLWNKKVSVESMQVVLAGAQFILDSGLFTWNSDHRRKFLVGIQHILESLIDAPDGALAMIVN